MRIYGDYRSGNCYKLKLVASLLAIKHEWVPVDIMAGEAGTECFEALNANMKIPVLELDDGRTLSESNAILNFLAAESELEPGTGFDRARAQQWQFFEQYSHEPYIAVARFIAVYQGMPQSRAQEFKDKQIGGHKALGVMEKQLMNTPYLVGNRLSTADISLYAYTHVANEGGFELQKYPAVLAWLARIRATPGYVGMETS